MKQIYYYYFTLKCNLNCKAHLKCGRESTKLLNWSKIAAVISKHTYIWHTNSSRFQKEKIWNNFWLFRFIITENWKKTKHDKKWKDVFFSLSKILISIVIIFFVLYIRFYMDDKKTEEIAVCFVFEMARKPERDKERALKKLFGTHTKLHRRDRRFGFFF